MKGLWPHIRPHIVFGRPLQLISHDGASHEPYFWRLLLINTPDFNVPPDRHIITKYRNKVFPAGRVLKEPAASIPAMVIFTIIGAIVNCHYILGGQPAYILGN